ncbi:MAG: glycosyltransferase family 8 protein [Clostridia bacterium]|nr:glycosyltransferase family 8 protein [Clostridia bacterium]
MTNILKKQVIPVVFAVDDNYAPLLSVALNSILSNLHKNCFLKVYVLNTGLSPENEQKIVAVAEEYSFNASIEYVDITERLNGLQDKIHLRDYYTKAIYYRIFIPSLFPEYEKILYVDCDVVLLDDIAKLFNVDLEDNIVGAVHEEAMSSYKCFGEYAEEFLDVPRLDYFNSGLLLINAKEYKKQNVEKRFIDLMLLYKFEVAPDQDYLNVLCKGKVKYLDIGWNKTPIPEKAFNEYDLKLIHYKLNFKPWLYKGVRYEEYFWKYAKNTPFYSELLTKRDNYTESEKERDELAFSNLQKMANDYVLSKNNYKKLKLRENQNAI